ncbi:MAG: Tetratricopeptide 2 repeat protein, partial [Pseudobdellovibrio sp.]|nr:Tetratricopeptide 2 repeat protein [Pseudobdellovibrio sp.]
MKKLFALIVLAVIFYYWPYTPQKFLIWDDEAILSGYKYFNPVNLQNFLELWLQPYNGLYTPVLKSLWAVVISVLQVTVGYDWAAKNVTLPFILINILLHAANTGLVYKLSQKVLEFFDKSKPVVTANFVALCFYAFHPLQIENVNWIMGTKELLWIHFALWSLLFYFRDQKTFTLLFFFLAVLSKPTAIILVPIFGLLMLLRNENVFAKKNLLLLLPQALTGLALVLWTEKMQPSTYSAAVSEKVLGAVDSFGFYIGKMVWPFPLSADYGRHYQWLQSQGWKTWEQLICVVFVLVLIVAYVKFKSERKFLIFLSALFFLPLLTTSGLIGLSFQTYSNVADHYASFSLIPVTLGLMLMLTKIKKPWLTGAVAGYILVFAVMGWSYKEAWA